MIKLQIVLRICNHTQERNVSLFSKQGKKFKQYNKNNNDNNKRNNNSEKNE